MAKREFNFRIAFALFVVIGAFICVQVFGAELKRPVKTVLESDLTRIALWAYVGAVVVLHGVLYPKLASEKTGFLYKHFGAYAETCFAFATYGFASTTSLALMKGLYLHVFYEGGHFLGFDGFDLISMFVLSSFLMVHSLIAVTAMGRELVFYQKTSHVVVKG